MKGFEQGHICLLIFLPLLLSGLASLSVSALYLRDKTKVLSLCRQYVLQIQGQMGRSLEQLQNLNPLAKRLRSQRKEIERLLLTAPPSVREVLLVRLSYVIAQQIQLNIKQRSVMRKAEGYAAGRLRMLKRNIRQPLVSSSRVPSSAKLAVVAKPRMSLSPSYHTSWNFKERQSIKVSWIERPLRIIPSFLKAFLGPLPSVDGTCRSTLRRANTMRKKIFQEIQEGGKWQPVLL